MKRIDPHGTRVRFNHGYHDAAWEVRHRRLRSRVMRGPQTTEQVSCEYSQAYFYGHEIGQKDAENGRYHGSSQKAWNAAGRKDWTK